jgi:RNA chaperone Hfq
VPPRKFEVAAERMPPKAPPSGQLKQFTGKELQRHAEWVRFRTRITIKLVNGEELEGYLKWTDQFSVKLVGRDSEYVIPKHSILYYAEAPRQRWNGPRGR